MLLSAILLTAITVDAAAFDRRASDEELLEEKRGRVVDAQTGFGLGGVQVVGVWDVRWSSYHGGGYGCALQKIVTTDANGYYTLPNIKRELDLTNRKQATFWSALFFNDYSSADYLWRVVAYKPGYLRSGDAARFQKYAMKIPPNYYPVAFEWQGGSNQSATTDNGIVRVEPIAMERDTLDPIQEIVYFDRMKSALTCINRRGDPIDPAEIRQDMRRRILPLPCAMPPDQLIDGETALEFASLVGGRELFIRLQQVGEPTSPPWKEISAGDVCSATRDVENP